MKTSFLTVGYLRSSGGRLTGLEYSWLEGFSAKCLEHETAARGEFITCFVEIASYHLDEFYLAS